MILLEQSANKKDWSLVKNHEEGWEDISNYYDDYETVCNGLIENGIFSTPSIHYRKANIMDLIMKPGLQRWR